MRFLGSAGAALAVLATLAISACDDLKTPNNASETPRAPPTAPVAAPFSHRIEGDLSGYYIPTSIVSVDGYRVKDVFVGQAQDFAAWEGAPTSATFAPVMIEFESMDGADVIRVLPTFYVVGDDRIRFEGTDAKLGQVAFDGRLDVEALATARRNLGDEAPVLTGNLRAAGTAVGRQAFRWYGGD